MSLSEISRFSTSEGKDSISNKWANPLIRQCDTTASQAVDLCLSGIVHDTLSLRLSK